MSLTSRFLCTPMTLRQMALATVAIIFGLGLYCLAYNGMRGQTETLANAFSWPVINILPFFAAWELSKTRSWTIRFAALVFACGASLLLDFLYGAEFIPGFELVRRLPALMLVTLIFIVVDFRSKRSTADRPVTGELPLLPSQIVRVTSSGNYVLLHTDHGSIIHRAPLQSVENNLEPHGFVRVHRTTLVRRDKIAKVRNNDIILADGTSIKTGARYRELLQAA